MNTADTQKEPGIVQMLAGAPRNTYKVFLICLIGVTFANLDHSLFTFVLTEISEEFGWSVVDRGRYIAITFVISGLMVTQLGVLTDRFGRKKMLLGATLLTPVFVSALTWVPNTLSLVIARSTGICHGWRPVSDHDHHRHGRISGPLAGIVLGNITNWLSYRFLSGSFSRALGLPELGLAIYISDVAGVPALRLDHCPVSAGTGCLGRRAGKNSGGAALNRRPGRSLPREYAARKLYCCSWDNSCTYSPTERRSCWSPIFGNHWDGTRKPLSKPSASHLGSAPSVTWRLPSSVNSLSAAAIRS